MAENAEAAPPRVFIAYSHDSPEHMDRVLGLADRLREEGVDAWLDQYEASPPAGWPTWSQHEIEGADFVLVVCTEACRRRFEKREEAGQGQGATWEGAILSQELYNAQTRNTRFIPVIFEAAEARAIPLPLQGATRYLLPAEYEALYRHLTAQPRVRVPRLGMRRTLPAQERRSEFPAVSADTSPDSRALEAAYQRLEERHLAGQDTTATLAEIVDLKRRMRAGGQVQRGDLVAGVYLLDTFLGTGGFATVWKAYDRQGKRVVAVKVLHSQFGQDRTRRERFLRGARTMARLDHPGIVRVLREGLEDDGYHFFIMEYLPGGDLQAAVKEKRLTTKQAVEAVLRVGEALQAAHEAGLVHRDVKPANILLDGRGGAKLTDFDLVRAEDSTAGTRTAAQLGTFLYAAPEGMSDAKTAGIKADLYSLAMTLCFVFHGEDLPLTALTRREDFLRGLSCPAAVREVLAKASEHEPERRYPTIRAFLETLKKARAPFSAPKPVAAPTPASRPPAEAQAPTRNPPARAQRPEGPRPASSPEAPPAAERAPEVEHGSPKPEGKAGPGPSRKGSSTGRSWLARQRRPRALLIVSLVGVLVLASWGIWQWASGGPGPERQVAEGGTPTEPVGGATDGALPDLDSEEKENGAPLLTASEKKLPPESGQREGADEAALDRAVEKPPPERRPRQENRTTLPGPAGAPVAGGQEAGGEPPSQELLVPLDIFAEGNAEDVFQALSELPAGGSASSQEITRRLMARKDLHQLFEQGPASLSRREVRSQAVLRGVALLLPELQAGRLDVRVTATMTWALDYFSVRDASSAERGERARELRAAITAALQTAHGKPPEGAFTWIPIQPGEFQMGSEEGEGDSDEHPAHRVKLTQGFAMLVHEVTNEQFRQVFPDHEGEANLPAVNVTWYQAFLFSTWLEGRLPTEAEWEYAARAGTSYRWVGTDNIAEVCEYANVADASAKERFPSWTCFECDDTWPDLAPVDARRPNPWQLLGMGGNAAEWVGDLYDPGYYRKSPAEDPMGPERASSRVLRGGSWWDDPRYARVAVRSGHEPSVRDGYLGFRVARSLPSSL